MLVDKIYFDMDGVLADFDRGVLELCGCKSKPQDDVLWDKIKETDHFFYNLKPIVSSVTLFYRLSELYWDSVEILTGIPKPSRNMPHAEQEKIDWVRDFISSSVVVHAVRRRDKVLFCKGESSILIDDMQSNIDAWNAKGGTGILFTTAKAVFATLKRKGILP